MASIEQVTIEDTPASQQSKPGIPKLDGWLLSVDRRYIAADTLEFMKFSFRAEIPIRELERVESVYTLFRHIKELYKGDEAKALGRLVYTLNLMGHKRFGRKAVRKLSEEYRIDEHNPKKDSRRAQLFQCLAEIGCRLSDSEEYKMRRYCARAVLQGVNPSAQSTESILSLFALLVHENKVTEENQEDLAYALTTIGADYCIDYIIEYRGRNNLPVKAYRDVKNPDFKSTKSSKTYSSKSSIQTESPIATPPTFSGTEYETAGEDYQPLKGHGSPLMKTFLDSHRRHHGAILEEETDSQRTDSHTEDTLPDEHTSLIEQPPGQKAGLCVQILVGVLAVFMMVIVIGIGGSVYGTVSAATHQYGEVSNFVYGSSVLPLIDPLLPYYLTNIDFTQNLLENLHVIDLYLIDSSCDQLNSTNMTVEETRTDQLYRITNMTGLYLLPGSEIEYVICALTNISSIAVHSVVVEVYLLDNLDNVWDQIIHPNEPIKYSVRKEFFACYENDSDPCPCWPVSFKIQHASYYSVLFTLNNPALFSTMQYNYSTSITRVTIDLPSQDLVLHECSLSDEVFDQSCNFPLNDTSYHLPWNMNKELCMLAEVHEVNIPPGVRSVKKDFSQTQVEFSQFSPSWLTISVSIMSVLVVILVVVVGIEVFLCWLCRKHSKVARGLGGN